MKLVFWINWKHLWEHGNLLYILIFQQFKIQNKKKSIFTFSVRMMYVLIIVLNCTKEIFELSLLLAMTVLFP